MGFPKGITDAGTCSEISKNILDYISRNTEITSKKFTNVTTKQVYTNSKGV